MRENFSFQKFQGLYINCGTRWTLTANVFLKEHSPMSNLRCAAMVWAIGFLRNTRLLISSTIFKTAITFDVGEITDFFQKHEIHKLWEIFPLLVSLKLHVK